MSRLRLIVVGLALLFAAYVVWQFTVKPATRELSSFELSAAAYQQLAQAQLATGLAPFPTTAGELTAARAAIGLSGAQWAQSTASNGGQVWQLGTALTLLCDAEGRLERLLYTLPAAGGLTPAGLGAALSTLSRLDKSAQQAHQLGADRATVYEAPFYLDYNTGQYSWRFMPQFIDGHCVGITVTQSQ